MVFSTTTLFKGIACPSGEECGLTNCIFSHDLATSTTDAGPGISAKSDLAQENGGLSREPPAKRRRVTYENAAAKPPSRADIIRSELAAARSGGADSIAKAITSTLADGNIHMDVARQTPSLTRPVTPPPTNGRTSLHPQRVVSNNIRSPNSTANAKPQPVRPEPDMKETLNPRLIPNDPAGHNKRSLFLKHLHAELVKLNQRVSDAKDLANKHLLHLSEQEVIKLALDDEEKIAKESSSLYPNIIKQRIAFYRKMGIEQWTEHVKNTFIPEEPKAKTAREAKPVDTGLPLKAECLILPHLVADQSGLARYGYIPTPPTEAEAAEAVAAAKAGGNFEQCDRCKGRFEVFPERHGDGRLTSGPCKHHPNRKVIPQRTKGEIASGLSRDTYFPCCNGLLGSDGCTINVDHVFKTTSPARLAAVLPFITTPKNDKPKSDRKGHTLKAVTFDCEMGYTTSGLELIRLTAVSWPAGGLLLDILVRPPGTIIDFNSQFSGVWPEPFANAKAYDDSSPDGNDGSIVENIERARELLCQYLTPTTPLIGHAIDNDLNVVRLCHPTIIDTIILFPHPRGGLPMRLGLKALTSQHLGRAIQTGGAQGHDSLEDAQATGDLVRFKIGEKWRLLSAQGWRMAHGKLVSPTHLQKKANDSEEEKALLGHAVRLDEAPTGKKRKKKRSGDGVESTEDEEVSGSLSIGGFVYRELNTKPAGLE
ncbi:RNA exonuclease 3 [Extremus antarcticus]|uniref:RNA exonuclease 3 n=1 Tax=Extremus antarcticus TaxID=702011 RepID=A0AAJ0DCP9_9PEZI|nr:RNA exonuclease 3 [Extremus antarcticus]